MGNFYIVQIFRMVTPNAKFEIANFKFKQLTFDLHTDSTLTMSLYRFFAKSLGRRDLPDPNGALSESGSPAAIKEANEAAKRAKNDANGEEATLRKKVYRQVCLYVWQPSGYSTLFEGAGSPVESYFGSDVENEVPR